MLSNRLQREGFEVVIARTGHEGVQLAHSEQPDLIIMDLVLPEMDGFEATRELRLSIETSDIPIIALSASVLPGDQHRAIDAGCDEFEGDSCFRINLFIEPGTIHRVVVDQTGGLHESVANSGADEFKPAFF